MKRVEQFFESFLWESRLVVLLAVVVSLLVALSMFFVATVDAFYMLSHLVHYASPDLTGSERIELRTSTVTHVVEVIDGFLLAIVLLIFSLGLYELFISKIDKAKEAENSSKVLLITSLDDLKSRLAKVILMILIVRFFEYALRINFSTALDLLMLAAGIALIGLSLYLSHLGDNAH